MTAVDTPITTTGDLLEVIRHAATSSPRSLQRAIGPSGVGTNCTRRLALQLLEAPQHNTTADKWPATVGVAVHAWLADAFNADNAARVAAGQAPRWLTEQQVTIRTGLSGSCDLLDLQTMTVVDHKTVGVANLRKYRANGHPGQQYETQLMLYGMGWVNAGLPIRTVAVIFYPRSGVLRDSWMWTAPYDPAIAIAALDRMDSILAAANVAEHAGGLDELMRVLPRETSMCQHCDFYTADRSVAPSQGCNGPLEDPDWTPPEPQSVAGFLGI